MNADMGAMEMIRFIAPEPTLPLSEQIAQLRSQFDAFLHTPALQDLFALLYADRHTISKLYNGRQTANGVVLETQDLGPAEQLEKYREALYPLLRELGFFDINRPLCREHSHMLVLGGSLEACRTRTECAANWMTPSVRYVDGLGCFRPINPKERTGRSCLSECETEFGALTKSFTSVFALSPVWKDDFHGNRNLNCISCVREFSSAEDNRKYRVFAAPSTQPGLRRADTGDSLLFYLRQEEEIRPTDSLLVITNNRYCNRQFLQIAFLLMKQACPVRFDVIGCTPDERIPGRERYDPFQLLQDLIGVLDWIDLFSREL